MDEQRVVHPDIVPGAGCRVPDAGLAPARETQRHDPGRARVAEFGVATAGQSRGAALRINDHAAAEATGAY